VKSIEQIQSEIARLRELERALRNSQAKGFITTSTLNRYQAKIEVLEWVLSEMP
jgi:hypothetical protein